MVQGSVICKKKKCLGQKEVFWEGKTGKREILKDAKTKSAKGKKGIFMVDPGNSESVTLKKFFESHLEGTQNTVLV